MSKARTSGRSRNAEMKRIQRRLEVRRELAACFKEMGAELPDVTDAAAIALLASMLFARSERGQ